MRVLSCFGKCVPGFGLACHAESGRSESRSRCHEGVTSKASRCPTRVACESRRRRMATGHHHHRRSSKLQKKRTLFPSTGGRKPRRTPHPLLRDTPAQPAAFRVYRDCPETGQVGEMRPKCQPDNHRKRSRREEAPRGRPGDCAGKPLGSTETAQGSAGQPTRSTETTHGNAGQPTGSTETTHGNAGQPTRSTRTAHGNARQPGRTADGPQGSPDGPRTARGKVGKARAGGNARPGSGVSGRSGSSGGARSHAASTCRTR
jgi:hypothetical protein